MLPLVVIVESAGANARRFAFADSPARVGRSPLAELQLVESFVSRWQGVIRFSESEITYCNVSSTNPTFVGEREAEFNDELAVLPGTVLRIGKITLRFVREPVPETDLRRKGKRKPKVEGEAVAEPTVWLGRGGVPDEIAARELAEARPASPTAKPPAQAEEAPAAAPASEPAMPAVLPSEAPKGREVFSPPGEDAAPLRGPAPELRVEDPVPLPVAPSAPAPLDALHQHYRAAWGHLFAKLAQELESTQPDARAQLAARMQRSYPQITMEPDFRALLKRFELEPRRLDIAEIGDWLRDLSAGLLPPKFRLDTGLTLQRILALTEVLTQSFAEVNDAQDQVRQRWLGRMPRTSVLRSDDARVILAYLLNPKADWSERLGELEECIREVVVHELALFKATLEGARALVDSFNPETLAKAEGIDLKQLEEAGGTGTGFWNRLNPRQVPEVRLWRKFMETYESLADGDRYQRVFMGRSFARTYLSAMGQGSTEANERSDLAD